MSELSSTVISVTSNNRKEKINTNLLLSFVVPLSIKHHLNPSSDFAFCKAISLMGEISKLSALIGS